MFSGVEPDEGNSEWARLVPIVSRDSYKATFVRVPILDHGF